MKIVAILVIGIIAIFSVPGEVVLSEEFQEQFSLPSVFEYPVTQGRDPFYPLVQAEEKIEVVEEKPLPVVTQSAYKLVGIAWEGKKSIALIAKEGQTWMVEEGMVVNGLRVLRIQGQEGEVTLVGEDRIIKLKRLEEVGEIK